MLSYNTYLKFSLCIQVTSCTINTALIPKFLSYCSPVFLAYHDYGPAPNLPTLLLFYLKILSPFTANKFSKGVFAVFVVNKLAFIVQKSSNFTSALLLY